MIRIMPNKTISVPEDVLPIINSLSIPFSSWVTEQLRRHAAQVTTTFAQQLVSDATLAAGEPSSKPDPLAVAKRMDRSAPW